MITLVWECGLRGNKLPLPSQALDVPAFAKVRDNDNRLLAGETLSQYTDENQLKAPLRSGFAGSSLKGVVLKRSIMMGKIAQ